MAEDGGHSLRVQLRSGSPGRRRAVHEAMTRAGQRRLAVIDDDSQRLLGLLCLKRSRTGFCTDEGVAAIRRARLGASSLTLFGQLRSNVANPHN